MLYDSIRLMAGASLRFVAGAAFFSLCAGLPASASAGFKPIELAPYLAEYELTLAGKPENDEIALVTGKLVLEFHGAACVGYTNDARIVTAIEAFDGERLVTDVRSRTIELPGGEMAFVNETFAEGERIEYSVGTAQRTDDGLRVDLTEPLEETFLLKGEIAYPTEQIIDLVRAAGAGKPFRAVDIYDGAENGRLVYHTAAVIGGNGTAGGDDFGELFEGKRRWPVTISYFERSDERADATPDFTMSFDLYENGIGRDFLIEYDDFALEGALTRIEPRDPAVCPD